jgi:N-acetylglucosaminyl-diphospho-decaprenol L-rhamnosyltransferase
MLVCASIACMEYLSVSKQCRRGITVSIVSHGQGRLVAALLEDLECCQNTSAIILTQNILEDDIPCPASLQSRLRVNRNERPCGFATNHNQAFRFCETSMFAILNPDIRLRGDPFPHLAQALEMSSGGVIAPAVRNSGGGFEDSARNFPTLLGLLRKLIGLGDGSVVSEGTSPTDVDWVAGMFLLFPASVYRELKGLDEGFFLYYEDVDICIRIWRSNRHVILHPGVTVIHDARRASRRKLHYMKWHLSSMLRFFVMHAWRLPR